MSRRFIISWLVGLALLCGYAISYQTLLQHRSLGGNAARTTTGVWDLPPVALLAVAGEFKGLMADYLTLEAGAQLGTQLIRTADGGFRVVEKKYDWPQIHRIFVASQSLDPSFAQTFLLAQGWLPWDAGMIDEANAILQKASDHRPWDWQPLRSMAFNYYFFENQPAVAGRLFLEAAQRPKAPSSLAVVGGRLAQKGGDTEAALALMKGVLADKTPEDPGYQDMVDRYHALDGTLLLEHGVVTFQQKYGRAPVDVKELLASGSIKAIPENPYGEDYCIDRSGKVYFDNPQCQEENNAKNQNVPNL